MDSVGLVSMTVDLLGQELVQSQVSPQHLDHSKSLFEAWRCPTLNILGRALRDSGKSISSLFDIGSRGHSLPGTILRDICLRATSRNLEALSFVAGFAAHSGF